MLSLVFSILTAWAPINAHADLSSQMVTELLEPAYARVTGLNLGMDPGLRLKYSYVDTLREDGQTWRVYEAVPFQYDDQGEVLIPYVVRGPRVTFKININTSEVLRYRQLIEDAKYVAFQIQTSTSSFGNLVLAEVGGEDSEAIAEYLRGKSPYQDRLQIVGEIQRGNAGQNAPWLDWRIANLSAQLEPSAERRQTLPPRLNSADTLSATWRALLRGTLPRVGRRLQVIPLVPTALLDERGRVLVGELNWGELRVNAATIPAAATLSEAQKLVLRYMGLLPDESLRQVLEKSPVPYGHGRLEAAGGGQQLVTPYEMMEAGAIGLPASNLNFKQVVVFAEGEFIFRVIFQNNLPGLVGRPLPILANAADVMNYQEPVMVWFGRRVEGGPTILGAQTRVWSPVSEGVIQIDRLSVDPTTKLVRQIAVRGVVTTSSSGGAVEPMRFSFNVASDCQSRLIARQKP